MTYELAKELKDAGFPQDWKTAKSFFDDQGELWTIGNCEPFSEWTDNPDKSGFHTPSTSGCGCCSSSIGTSVNDFVRCPTLSELIAAIGKLRFISLESCIPNELCSWRATGLDSDVEEVSRNGSTPEEAVARLWLALNKKDGTES